MCDMDQLIELSPGSPTPSRFEHQVSGSAVEPDG